jgi:hypothetical protein
MFTPLESPISADDLRKRRQEEVDHATLDLKHMSEYIRKRHDELRDIRLDNETSQSVRRIATLKVAWLCRWQRALQPGVNFVVPTLCSNVDELLQRHTDGVHWFHYLVQEMKVRNDDLSFQYIPPAERCYLLLDSVDTNNLELYVHPSGGDDSAGDDAGSIASGDDDESLSE